MNFKSKVDEGAKEYGGLPFWSWNDNLQPDELRRQMRVMKEKGMNGFFMHARGGLETEYLSDDWYKCIEACIDEAKKLDMEAWSYDENGWPSGFAGGKVLENPMNFATYLTLEETAEFPVFGPNEPPKTRPIAAFIMVGDSYKLVLEPVAGVEKYYVINQGYDSSYVDVMNPKVTDEFISFTHKAYKDRLGDNFGGKYMPGFFTDEPQYFRYRTTWSNIIAEEFEKAYGYSIYDKLIGLFKDFEGAEEFRYDYWYLAHKLFIKNFQQKIYEWCHENGCKTTGHAIEESGLFMQMWCCGGVMPFYEFEDMPGMDFLGRGVGSDLAPKQLGSVAAQLGKKKVLTETFACCGWDVSPTELKRIADIQYAGGVNVMCHHLYAYSIRGQRKRDYPANYSEHLPWQNAFGDFVKYYDRLGFLLADGKEKVNTLIIHPMHSCYLNYKREVDLASIEQINNDIIRVITNFSNNQIPYHFGDEEIMAKYGKVTGNKLAVGQMEYKYVVIPKAYTLDGTTVKLLKEFAANGGKIFVENEMPTRVDGRIADYSWLSSNVTFDDIKNDAYVAVVNKDTNDICDGIKAMSRDNEFGRLYFVTNVSEANYTNTKVVIKNAKSAKEIFLDECIWKDGNGIKAIDGQQVGDDFEITASFESGKSHLYIVDDKESVGTPENAEIDGAATIEKDGLNLNGDYKVVFTEDNAVTLDYAMISLDGGHTYQKPKPIIEIFDELLRERFKGELFIKYIFDIKKMPKTLNVCVEPMKFKSFKVNCAPVTFGEGYWLDRQFKVADIKEYCSTGRNVIDISYEYYQDDYVYYVLYGGVSESLRNCLNFNTEVESIYLFGDFGVSTENEKFADTVRNASEYTGKFVINEKPTSLKGENIVKEGFPFFAGKITLEQEFNGESLKNPEIWVNGRYSYADIEINGKFVKRLMFTKHADISDFVDSGTNTLRITLCNSNRNLLGPHHFADPEPYALGPVQFSLENMWHDGKCDLFAERYSFVRFGIDVKIVNK